MRKVAITLAAIIGLGLTSPAHAQTYPSKPIKVVVPLTPGSPVDVVGRLVGQHLSTALKQPVIIENRPGAGATIGAKSVAIAEPDGYTLLHTAANHVIAPAAFKNLSYDPIGDFAPVGATATSPFVVVLTPTLPIKTIPELIAYAKANPGKMNWGYGLGTSPHLIGEMFKHITKADISSIPYKGGAQAVTDILGGQIHMNIGTTATVVPLVRSGKLRALAVIGEGRYRDLPERADHGRERRAAGVYVLGRTACSQRHSRRCHGKTEHDIERGVAKSRIEGKHGQARARSEARVAARVCRLPRRRKTRVGKCRAGHRRQDRVTRRATRSRSP